MWKSDMWNHFKKVDENTISCNSCSMQVTYKYPLSQSTTSIATMTRHYNKNHKISDMNNTNEKYNKIARPKKELETTESHWLKEELNTIYADTSSTKRRKSNISRKKSSISRKKSSISRKKSRKRKNYKPKNDHFIQMDTLAAERISNYSSDKDHRYAKIADDILDFICTHYRSYNIIQCEEFKHLMKALDPHSENTIKKRLDAKYDMEIKILKEILNETSHVTLSVDAWSKVESCESFLSVTVNFIASETRKLKSINIEIIKLSEQHTADCIVFVLLNIFKNWCIDTNKVAAVVTNNESNIVKAVKQIFGQDKHIICFIHTINLVIENCMKICKGLSNIINKVRSIVKFIKNNIDNELHCCQVNFGTSKIKLNKLILLDVNTKWNSIFYMLEGFVELWTVINDVFFKDGYPEMPTDDEFIILKEIVVLLRPLAFIVQECLTEKYIAVSKIIPLINCALTEYNNVQLTTELSMKLKETILMELQRSFGSIEFIDSISIATILDPRFKTIHFQNEQVVKDATYKLHEMIRELSCSSHEFNTEQKEIKYDLWTHHKFLVLKHENELSSYLTSPVSFKDDNPLEKWEIMKTQYPLLYKIAQKYLSIVATSVRGERLFSKMEMTQSRNELTEPKTLNKILFLNSIN